MSIEKKIVRRDVPAEGYSAPKVKVIQMKARRVVCESPYETSGENDREAM